MHRFRKIALAFTAMAVCSLFFAISCQKQELDLTPEELDTINAHSIDYALQVIPDIHRVMPLDLIEAMDSIPTGKTLPNGQPEIISALHFGDNPPKLYKTINDTVLGFITEGFKIDSTVFPDTTIYKYVYLQVKKYIPSGSPVPTLEEGTRFTRPFNFLFHDQHRGVAQSDFKDNYMDNGPDQYIYEIDHITDSVFIMGEGDLFTAYYYINTEKKKSASIPAVDNRPHRAVILSGKVTPDGSGICNLYFGFKTLGYDIPPIEGSGLANVNDIVILTPIDTIVPFRYWDPNHSYD